MPRVFHPIIRCSIAYLRYAIGTTQCQTAFGYQWSNTTTPTVAELSSLATEVFQVFQPKMSLFLRPRVLFTECYARNMDVVHANEATYIPPAPLPGSRGGTDAPANVAFAITKRTGLTGYGYHGYFMFSGFSTTDLVSDAVDAFITTSMASVGTSVLAPRVGGRFVPALASFKSGVARTLNAIVVRNILLDDLGRRLPSPH